MDEQERPVEVERETTVINTGTGGSGGGLILLVVVLIAAAAITFLFFGGYFERAGDKVDVNVNVEAPKAELPNIKLETPKSEPAEAPANSAK